MLVTNKINMLKTNIHIFKNNMSNKKFTLNTETVFLAMLGHFDTLKAQNFRNRPCAVDGIKFSSHRGRGVCTPTPIHSISNGQVRK